MNLQTLLDRPIAFQRAFVTLGAGITGALMLSQSVYWSSRCDDVDGWFYKTMSEWEDETGLTRSEQEGARRKLVKIGVLEEMKKGVPCRLYYRVNMEALAANLGAENPKTSTRETRKPVCRKPAYRGAENLQTSVQDSSKQACREPAFLTETTTEITAETTQRVSAGEAAPSQPAGATTVVEIAPRCAIPDDMPGPKDQTCKTFKAWANYAMAYRRRYSAWPVWNAKVAGQVGQLIDRLGADVAHHVAAYFLTINDARLINGCHALGDLLAKAESYHTQWATNRQMNGTTARQLEQTQANINAAQEAAERIRNRQGGKTNAFL